MYLASTGMQKNAGVQQRVCGQLPQDMLCVAMQMVAQSSSTRQGIKRSTCKPFHQVAVVPACHNNRWIAVGVPTYFKADRWNGFDFFIVCLSIAGVGADFGTTSTVTVLPLLRVLRVARVVKLARRARGLRIMMATLVWSAPAIFNIGTVLFLVMFMYSIAGMSLFGNIKLGVSCLVWTLALVYVCAALAACTYSNHYCRMDTRAFAFLNLSLLQPQPTY